MFCNDGTISDGLDSYSRYYAENNVKERDADKSTTRNEDHTGTVYYGQTEQAGTFHMDGTYSRSCDYHSGNKIGYHPNNESSSNKVLGRNVGDSYTYFYIYRRIIQTEGSQGKSNLFTGKKAYAAADGTYTIDLQSYATGATQSAISDKGVPPRWAMKRIAPTMIRHTDFHTIIINSAIVRPIISWVIHII